MIELIFALKFVHELAAAAMFGTWLGIASFMWLAHRSGNVSVVAVTARFAVGIELAIMAGAITLQPLSGFALAWAIGLSPPDEFWINVSLALYGLIVVAWLAVLRLEIRIRDVTRKAVLGGMPLPETYQALFHLYSALVWPALAIMVAVFALMVWQPRPS